MSKFEKYLQTINEDSLNETSIKDCLNKIEDGERLSNAELKKLSDLGLVDTQGKPTQKAKEKFSSLYEAVGGIRKVIIKKDEAGDYKIPYPNKPTSKDDDGFAYTDSKEDAIGTAKSMYKKVDNVIIKLGGKVILHKEDGKVIV